MVTTKSLEQTKTDLSSTSRTAPTKSAKNDTSVKKSKRFDLGGMGVARTLEMLKEQLNQAAEKDETREKVHRSLELDKMTKLRQAGVTKEYSRTIYY